ncbi:MAG TPA: bifunctional lysylphosphatidylglycerol flippase/synthetase MprF [Prolixibacteraceae bacterium]|nr:bifunctional lysylphosphatidylglycerol flippase/synthetase MprF [Prolixibacteraceae bacterium]
MEQKVIQGKFLSFFKERFSPFFRENGKTIAQIILTLFFFGIGIWFIRHESAEFSEIKTALVSARWQWVLAGISITLFYIFLQGMMYVFSFAAVGKKVSLGDSIMLFLKRNFISVFLPAGGVSSLAFFTGNIEKKGIKKTKIHFASTIYGFVGILSVVIVAIPAFIYAILRGGVGAGEWFALIALILLIIGSFFLYRSLMQKGWLYWLIVKYFPSSEFFLNEIQGNDVDRKKFLFTVIASVFIEFTGIAHLYISMTALGFHPSLFAAVMGYIISIVFLLVSPFLRGLGAVEVSMSYLLIRFGFSNVEAISVTFLYRFFEFWLPLFSGLLAFLSKLNKLLMRVLPAILLLGLGIINIVSVLTPAVSERLIRLKEFVPMEVIHASNYMVMFAGFFLLVTAAFMLKGLKNAWWFALVLSVLSFVGHITKAIDYEEATVALVVIGILVATRKEYYIKPNRKLSSIGIQSSLFFMVAVLAYGIIGFYFLDQKHFGIDFSFLQSVRYTLQNYFLVGSSDLVPADPFANHFLVSINISGFLSIAFLIYTFVQAYKAKINITGKEFEMATNLLASHGNSSVDYFKTYSDKFLYFSDDQKAFISYRISGNFAVVLENPVAENPEEMKNCMVGFDKFCMENGLKSIYYRVPEESLPVYHELRKKELFIGQEGVVDITKFTLEGGSKKSLRNAINKVKDQGYKATVILPPVKDGILQKIKSVSDEWLESTGRSEIIFSQGMFVWNELKQQTIITVENSEEKIVAFLNIIPEYVKGEATYDLIRKTQDAPNGVMDFILIELFNYLKSMGYTNVNLGFAPMSGIDDPHTFPERSMRFAYQKIKSFSHYKGLREYKEKFDPVWYNKYLIYQHDYDLLQVPAVLTKVIKP